jgi:hypothetical protein
MHEDVRQKPNPQWRFRLRHSTKFELMPDLIDLRKSTLRLR